MFISINMCSKNWNGIRWALVNTRKISQSSASLVKNHYEVLEISQRATQNDIKAAYYKLSMLYHPDKNKGSDVASEKFKDITAAYEVLGNYKLRRLYDRGIVGTHTTGTQYASPQQSDVPEDPRMKFYRSRERRHMPPTPMGKSTMYDFDEWARAHYGTQFAKQQEIKRRVNYFREKRRHQDIDIKSEKTMYAIGAMVIFIMYLSYAVNSGSEDMVLTNKRKGQFRND